MPGRGADPVGRDRHPLGLDERLERQTLVDDVEGAVGVIVAVRPAGEEPRQRGVLDVEHRRDRGAAVLAAQLAELPLPAEHPQRIGDERLQTLAAGRHSATSARGATT